MLSYTLWRGQSYVFAVPTSSWILYSKPHYRKAYRTFYQRKRPAVAAFWRSEGLPNVMKFLWSHSRDKLCPTSSQISLILTREPSKMENTHTPGPNTLALEESNELPQRLEFKNSEICAVKGADTTTRLESGRWERISFPLLTVWLVQVPKIRSPHH